MVDCPEYEKQKLSKEQIFWQNYFKDSVNEKEELSFDLYVDGKLNKGSESTFNGKKLDDLINPDYEFYEIIKRLIMLYEEHRGGSALAALSSHYQNYLLVLAAIYQCANHQELEIWEQKFNKKFKTDDLLPLASSK